eukprot:3138926-Alexandrium_andersonii.AAC.1
MVAACKALNPQAATIRTQCARHYMVMHGHTHVGLARPEPTTTTTIIVVTLGDGPLELFEQCHQEAVKVQESALGVEARLVEVNGLAHQHEELIGPLLPLQTVCEAEHALEQVLAINVAAFDCVELGRQPPPALLGVGLVALAARPGLDPLDERMRRPVRLHAGDVT